MRTTFVIAEDRIAEEVGVRLTLLSLRQFCPETDVLVFRPNPSGDFLTWLREFPKVSLVPSQPKGGNSWNCKPQALLHALDQGFDQAIWIDSDAMVTMSHEMLFNEMAVEEIAVAQEIRSIPMQGTRIRTIGWGLEPGTDVPITINSCIVRVTHKHVPLLKEWERLLSNPQYLDAQKLPLLGDRPVHFQGDQDALNALLGSVSFADVPVHFLRCGVDIIHVGGASNFSVEERIKNLWGKKPLVIHLGGPKPWIAFDRSRDLTGRFWVMQRLILEVSAYFAQAKTYSDSLGGDTAWLQYSSPLGILLRILGFGSLGLTGFPLAAIAKARKWTRPRSQNAQVNASGVR